MNTSLEEFALVFCTIGFQAVKYTLEEIKSRTIQGSLQNWLHFRDLPARRERDTASTTTPMHWYRFYSYSKKTL